MPHSHVMLLRRAGVLNFVNGTCDAMVIVGPLSESQVAPLVRCLHYLQMSDSLHHLNR